jgi:hypothetical protein
VGRGVGGRVKEYGGFCILWPLCVFDCISVVLVEGICVRDFRGLELCAVGTVGCWQVVSV